MYFQNDLDAINNARQQHGQQQQHVINNVGRRQLKEQRISPKDLVELDANTYTEMKNQGLNIDQVRQNKHKALDKDEFNFNIQFVKPNKGRYQRKQVFLPDKNTKYSDLNFNKGQQHRVQSGPKGPQLQQTFNSNVRTNIQTYQQPYTQTSYSNNQVYTQNRQYRTPSQSKVYSQSYVPQQQYVQHGQQVVRRTYHKSNGEVVDVTNDPQYAHH